MNTKKDTPLNRRSFLKRSALTGVLALFSNWFHSPFATAQETSKKLFRRVRPGDAEWPNQQAWDDLARKVAGRLVSAELPYQVCIDQPQSSACASRLEELKNPFFIQEQPGGTQSTGWLNGWEARPSVQAVAATTPRDVAEAVKFANKHRLRLVIKGGAHEYLGRSNSADSLMVWTRGMDGLELHDGFVPAGAPAGTKPLPAITVEAGAIWLQAYDKVTTQAGRVVLGGGCTTVGVAGHVQQGGYGSFSKRWGTSAQNLLQAEVVTAGFDNLKLTP
ncbi:MAG TPA: FAD-dependent oxidoreductase [Desulfobacterales bacterium]